MAADFSQYVDLTIFDKQSGELYQEAIEMARLTLPEFNLRQGTVEDAIFQAASYIAWQMVAGINRLPDSLMSGILSMMGVSLRPAIPAELNVVVTADSYDGAVIPAGTLFGYSYVFEDEVIDFVFASLEAAEIDPVEEPEVGEDYPSTEIACEAIFPGLIPIIAQGEELKLLSPSTDLLSAVAGDGFQNGFNEETSAEFLSRAVSYLNSLSSTLAKSTQVDAFVANTYPATVSRVQTYDLTNGDPDTGNRDIEKTYEIGTYARTSNETTIVTTTTHQFLVGDTVYIDGIITSGFDGEFVITDIPAQTSFVYTNPGTNQSALPGIGATAKRGKIETGHIAVYVYGQGSFLSTEQKDVIRESIADASIGGLTINIGDTAVLPINITGEIVLDSSYDREPLEQVIENSLIEYLSPQGFPTMETKVRKNQIIGIISRIPGVRYVSDLTISDNSVDDDWLYQIGDDLEPAVKGWAPSLTAENISFTYTAV
jgi:uncharacterized phage protein gp47/JayE